MIGVSQTIAVMITFRKRNKERQACVYRSSRKKNVGFEFWIIYRRAPEDIKYERIRYKKLRR